MLRSTEELEALSKINPELEAILKQTGPLPDITSLEPAQIREAAKLRVRQLPSSIDTSFNNVTTNDITIPARDHYAIPARVYKPIKASQSGSPLIVNYHGGGFVLGGLDNDDLVCKVWVQELGVVVVSVDYRLAPEYKFPIGVNDAWDSLKWVAAKASSLDANPTLGFIISGTSAGANFADVAAHLARDTSLSPPLTGSLLIIPTLIGDPTLLPPHLAAHHLSQRQNANAPLLNSTLSSYFMSHYAPDRSSHLYRPFFWPDKGHKGMPKTCFLVCGMDPLRDDAFVYQHALEEEGVKTRAYVYSGCPHGFLSVFPQIKEAERFVREGVLGLGWLLGREG